MIPTSKLKKLILHQVALHVENSCGTDLPIWDIISKKISGEFGEISALKVKEVFYKEVVPSLPHCNYGITNEATLNTIRKMSLNPMASTLPTTTLAAANPSHIIDQAEGDRDDRMNSRDDTRPSIEFTEITMETTGADARSFSQTSDPLHISSQADYVVHSTSRTDIESSQFEDESEGESSMSSEIPFTSSEAETKVTESTIIEQAEPTEERMEEEHLDYEYLERNEIIDYREVAAADDDAQDQFEVSSSTASPHEVPTSSEEFPAEFVQQEVSRTLEDPPAIIETTTDPQVDNEFNEDVEELRAYQSLEFFSGLIAVSTMLTPNTERLYAEYGVLASPVIERAPNDFNNSMASIPEVDSPQGNLGPTPSRTAEAKARNRVGAATEAKPPRTPLSVRLARIVCADSETSDDDNEAIASDCRIEAAVEPVAKKGEGTTTESTRCETPMSVKISGIIFADSETSDDDNEAVASDPQIEAAAEPVAIEGDGTSTKTTRCETPISVKISRIIFADSETSEDEEADAAKSSVQPTRQDEVIVISDSEDEEVSHQVESANINGEFPVSPGIHESEDPDENDFGRWAKFTSTQITIDSPPLFYLPEAPTRPNLSQKRSATNPISDALPAKTPRIVPFAQAYKEIMKDRESGRNKRCSSAK